MRLLQERRRAWRTLDFKRCISVPTPGDCHAYELVGGMFAKAMNPHTDAATAPTTFPLNPGSRHFSFVTLPSAERGRDGGPKCEMVVREDVGLLCRDFGIDPTQDLIALVEQPDLYVMRFCFTMTCETCLIPFFRPHMQRETLHYHSPPIDFHQQSASLCDCPGTHANDKVEL